VANYVRTYKFLGTGMLWDAEDNKVLCQFDRNGVFETSDPAIIRKMVRLRVPVDDGQADALADAEYAIELLTERVNVLERMNEELKIKLETYGKQKEVDVKPVREALIAELEYYGLPYVATTQDKTLQIMLDEYKQFMRIKSEEKAGFPYVKDSN